MKKNVSLQQKVVKENLFLKNLFLRKREQKGENLIKREGEPKEKGGMGENPPKEKGGMGENPPKEENKSNYILLFYNEI